MSHRANSGKARRHIPFAPPQQVPFTIHDSRFTIQRLNVRRDSATLVAMGKTKISGTGKGYLGETMVHRISGAMGVVENVVEAKAGWPPEITLKLPDGSTRKGKLSDFRELRDAERKKISPPAA